MHTFKVGARDSALSVAQSKQTIATLESVFPDIKLELVSFKTAGDTDKKTSLTDGSIPDNFFSDTLDQSVINGHVDAAIHSAKDLPDYDESEIAWFTIPWREDNRDCIILRKDRIIPDNPKIGGSSVSREVFAQQKWPNGKSVAIRGDIENRIAQLDEGVVDVLILAVAGLKRLGLNDRITEILPTEELPTHPSQGKIAITFKKDNPHFLNMRMMLVETLNICGAGTGKDGNYTHSVTEALNNADLCLKDSLMDVEILNHCNGKIEEVGKRYHDEASSIQSTIHKKMLDSILGGDKVVRLKGGDPALFGRLIEELDFINKNHLPWRVHPGIPWFCSATLKHGIMITSRMGIRQFTVTTGTQADGETIDCNSLNTPLNGSIFFYMATRKIDTICKNLIDQGMSTDTPAAIFREDEGDENIVRGTLEIIEEEFKKSSMVAPAIFMVGEATLKDNNYKPQYGPLNETKILSCGTDHTKKVLDSQITKYGGTSIPLKLFDLKINKTPWIRELSNTDWVILSSASAASFFIKALIENNVDLRDCPNVATSGPSASKELLKHGIHSDYEAMVFTSESLANELIENKLLNKASVMVLNSSASLSKLSEKLKPHCASLKKFNLYNNIECDLDSPCPDFDIASFCSPSAFNAFENNFPGILKGKKIASIGPVTSKAIEAKGYTVDIEPRVYDAVNLMRSIASKKIWG
jgi:uroporphyrinogen III methyltransferase / synthase